VEEAAGLQRLLLWKIGKTPFAGALLGKYHNDEQSACRREEKAVAFDAERTESVAPEKLRHHTIIPEKSYEVHRAWSSHRRAHSHPFAM
jgi:hypothetical protein